MRTLVHTVADRLGLISESQQGEATVHEHRAARAPSAAELPAAVAEALAEADSDEAAAEQLLALIRAVLDAACVALWIRHDSGPRSIAEAGIRTGAARRDLVARACSEQRPVRERAPGTEALVVPVCFRGAAVGAIEIAGGTTRSHVHLDAILTVAHISAAFLTRIRAVAEGEETRRLLAAVLEELDEGVLVTGENQCLVCSNRRMTELLASLQPDGAAVQDRLDRFLSALPADGVVLEENLVVTRPSGTASIALHGVRLSVAGGCTIVVASDAIATPATPRDGDEEATKRLAALGTFSAVQGRDIARLARTVVEQLHAIEAGSARGVPSQAGHLEAIVAARASAVGVGAIGDEITHIQESAGVVLIVDDEEATRSTLTRWLERAGYRVYTAADGSEALALAKRYAGLIDIVVCDLVLPVMSGQRLLHELAEWQPQARHLLISGLATGDFVHLGRNGRPLPFLAKPFSYDTLVAAVAALGANRTASNPAPS